MARITKARPKCVENTPEAQLDGSRRRHLGSWRPVRYHDCYGRDSGAGALCKPELPSSPWFLQHTPGLHAWVFAAWIPLFLSNILGEELCWRGYVLPRQEARFGRAAWLPNGILWCLFHWSFGWPIMVTLLPITLLLPWIVQRRRNTWVGIIIHAIFNAAGFILATSGVGT